MPRPPFWVFSLAGFLFFYFFFFSFFLMSLISWLNELFWGIFCLPFFLSLSHFDALSRSLSYLDVLAHFYAWWIFPFLMKSLLDESCIPLSMMNFRLFKLDAHLFFFSHIDRISWSLISTHLSCLLGEFYQLASKLQGWVLLNMRFKYAWLDFSHHRFRF